MNKILSNLEQIPILTAAAVFFILGILIEGLINIPFFVLLVFCFVIATIAFLKHRQNLIFTLSFLFLCLGLGGLHLKGHLRLPGNNIGLLKPQNIKNMRLRGIIDSDPLYGKRKISFTLGVNKVLLNHKPEGDGAASDSRSHKSQSARGKILVNIFRTGKFSYGDELILESNLYRPFNFGSGSNFSYRDYLRSQGIAYILSVKKENKIVFLSGKKGKFFKSLAFKLKHKFEDIFKQYLWPVNSDVLSAIILGERQNFPQDIKRTFIQTGTVHIIAISGFNVGIVVFLVLIFLKAVGVKRKVRYLITVPILIIHMLAVGASSSVVRATLMALIVLIAYLIGREPHIINSLSLAALFILGYNPLQIFDIGFQLSFVSVLGIVILSPRIIPKFAIEPILRRGSGHKRMQANFGITSTLVNLKDCPGLVLMKFCEFLRANTRKSLRDFLGRPCPAGRADFAITKSGIINLFKINPVLSLAKEFPLVIKGRVKQKLNILVRVILNSFSVSLSAWLATFGFVAYYFRIISPVTILANLIIVPLASLAIILGFTLGLSATVCPVLSPSIAATTNFVLLFLFRSAYGFSRLPFAYFYF